MDVAFEERVRNRAYEIWEAEGRPSDRALAHWDRAMKEMAPLAVASVAAPKTKTRKVKAAAMAVAGIAKQAKAHRTQTTPAGLN